MFTGLYVKIAVGAAIVAALFFGVQYVRGLQDTVEELGKQNAVLNEKISDQNSAIELLSLEAKERLVAAQAEIEKAQAATVEARKRARIIYRTPPSTPGDSCKSALDLVNGVQ